MTFADETHSPTFDEAADADDVWGLLENDERPARLVRRLPTRPRATNRPWRSPGHARPPALIAPEVEQVYEGGQVAVLPIPPKARRVPLRKQQVG